MKEIDVRWKAFNSYKPLYQKVYGVILISKNNRVLLVKGRCRNIWSFPKGHYKASEGELNCALRECFEETGISLRDVKYNYYRKLSSGSYFIYTDMEEEDTIIQDLNEISEVSWVSIAEMLNLRTNIDVSRFLQLYKDYISSV